MRLLKARYVTLYNFTLTKNLNGTQSYVSTGNVQVIATVMPYKIALVPDFQIDVARIKDHWILYTNKQIKSDQTVVVKIGERYFLPVYSEDTKFLDKRDGYFKTIVKINVDQGYGLVNG